MESNAKWITSAILLVISGAFAGVYVYSPAGGDLCDNFGLWNHTGITIFIEKSNLSKITEIKQYHCPTRADSSSKENLRFCERISSSRRTCYPGFKYVKSAFLADTYDIKSTLVTTETPIFIKNNTCIYAPASPENGTPERYTPCSQYNHTIRTTVKVPITVYSKQALLFDGGVLFPEELGFWCYDNLSNIICKSLYDGNGWQHTIGVIPGTTWFSINTSGDINPMTGHRVDNYDSFRREAKWTK